jgi:ATP-dependent Clp protease adaptor protein ClpS
VPFEVNETDGMTQTTLQSPARETIAIVAPGGTSASSALMLEAQASAPHFPKVAVAVAAGGDGPNRDANDDENGDGGSKTGLVTKTRPKTKKPSLYRVLLLNDDFTPMEFVTHVLQKYFNKSREEAERVMLHVHQKGVGICGVYTYEVAETKVTQVMDFSRKNSHPLQCTMEKE